MAEWATLTVQRERGAEYALVEDVGVRAGTSNGHAATVKLHLHPLVVGSAAEADIFLGDSSVSRNHCRLQLTDRGVRVVDLGSKNGTRVNGLLVQEAIVPVGSALLLGEARLEIIRHGVKDKVALSPRTTFGEAYGGSVPMRALFAQLQRATASDEPVLLRGDSGTGKGLLARALHDESARRDGPFVVVDCAAISSGLMEDALFGHARGAFTGAHADAAGLLEQAHRGTLLLDGVDELPAALQPKLLRALEERVIRRLGDGTPRPVDVRFVCATRKDVVKLSREGHFRADLGHRLAVLELQVPLLRDRKEDIPKLVELLLTGVRMGERPTGIPAHLLELFKAHHWPGNVRELKNAVIRLALFPELGPDALKSVGLNASFAESPQLSLPDARELVVAQFERSFIAEKLKAVGGNVSAAAKAMGVTRQLVHRLMARHGLATPDE